MQETWLEPTVFALALSETVERFNLVATDLIQSSRQVHWLEGKDGEVRVVSDLKLNPSQFTNIRWGKKDARGRSFEGILLAIWQHSFETGDGAFDFYLSRLSELLQERGQDFLNQEISQQRRDAFQKFQMTSQPRREVEVLRQDVDAAIQALQQLPRLLSIQDLLLEEFVARGLNPDLLSDRQKFANSAQAIGMDLSVEDVILVLEGGIADDFTLGRLQNVIINRTTGDRYSMAELIRIRDRQLVKN